MDYAVPHMVHWQEELRRGLCTRGIVRIGRVVEVVSIPSSMHIHKVQEGWADILFLGRLADVMLQ